MGAYIDYRDRDVQYSLSGQVKINDISANDCVIKLDLNESAGNKDQSTEINETKVGLLSEPECSILSSATGCIALDSAGSFGPPKI